MKISKKWIVLFAAAALFASCSSSKNVEAVPSDAYSEETEGDRVSTDSAEEKTAGDAKPKAKKKSGSIGEAISNGITNFFSSKFSPYDETTLFTAGTFGGIKQQNAITVIYPKDGTAGFGSPIMAAYYYLTFDANGRKKLASAVNQYLNDFENKKLKKKSKKSYKTYGTVKSNIYWGTVKTSSPNFTKEATIYLGYEFEKNSPYFTLFMYPATNGAYTGPDSNFTESSITLHYYFTKAQAQSLVSCLTDERVAEALYDYELEKYGVPAESDMYDEDDGSVQADGDEIDDDIVSDGTDDTDTFSESNEMTDSLSDEESNADVISE